MSNFHKILKSIGEEGEDNAKLASPSSPPKSKLKYPMKSGSSSGIKLQRQTLKPPKPKVEQ